MVATFIGAANAPASGDSEASSRSVTKPAGAQVAVFFVNFWIGDGDGAGAITPSGAAVGATLRNNTVVGDARTATFIKYVDGDATGATYTFSFTPGDPWSALKAIFFADVDAGLTLSTVPFNTANTGGTGYATTTVTTVSGAALAWNGNAAEYSTAPTHTPPANFTEVGDTDMSASAYRISPGDGSQSASGASTSGSISNKISTLVALAPAAGGGATVEGTAALTLGGLALTAAGRRVVHGSGSLTLGGLTLTASGRRVAHGTASVTLGGLTLSATGRRTVHGAAALPLGGLDLAAAGVVEGVTTGTANLSLGGLSLTATGRRVVHGTATIDLGALTLTAVGQVEGVTTGVATLPLAGLALTATGKRVVHGTVLLSLGGLVLSVVVDTADPNPLDVTYTEPSRHITHTEPQRRLVHREQASIIYQEA